MQKGTGQSGLKGKLQIQIAYASSNNCKMCNNLIFKKGKQAKMDISRSSAGTLNDPITVSN